MNSVAKRSERYIYSFGSTTGIELLLSESGFSISVEYSKELHKKEMLSEESSLFADGIRKALLLYLLKYSKPLKIHSFSVRIDDLKESEKVLDGANPPIYSMIDSKLLRKVPEAFSSDTMFSFLLHTPKSKYDRRIASLFAWLFSKSKVYETERFLYLWTSLNGMYGWLAECIASTNHEGPYRKEHVQISGLLQFLSAGEKGINGDKDKARIAKSVIALLKRYNADQVNREYVQSGDLGNKIEKRLVKEESDERYQLTAYGYLLTQLAYYFRCKLVHGDKPVLLFSYAENSELHALQIINNLLEEFIEANLANWFDDAYIQETIIPKVREIRL